MRQEIRHNKKKAFSKVISVLCLTWILFVQLFSNGVWAISNEDYAIELPEEFESMGNNLYYADDLFYKGRKMELSFCILMFDFNSDNSLNPYSSKGMEAIKEALVKDIRENSENTFKEFYSQDIVDIGTEKYKAVVTKYKVESPYGFLIDSIQYDIFTSKKQYCIGFSTTDSEYMKEDEQEAIVDTLVLKNFTPYESAESHSTPRSYWTKYIGFTIAGIIGAAEVTRRRKKNTLKACEEKEPSDGTFEFNKKHYNYEKFVQLRSQYWQNKKSADLAKLIEKRKKAMVTTYDAAELDAMEDAYEKLTAGTVTTVDEL